MTLNQIKYFQTVARLQNYHLAAAELYVSQPSLSRSVAALERELGIPLFEKNGRGVTLTKYGTLFLEHVDRILSEYTLAESRMKKISGGGGCVDVGYVMPMADSCVPQAVRDFLSREENRGVTFRFFEGWTSAILKQLKEGRLDVGFCACVEQEREVEFLPVWKQEVVLIAPRDSPLSAQNAASVRELGNYPVISYHRYSWMGTYTQDLYRRLEIHPNIICECTSENGIQAMVETGLGIALVQKVRSLDPNRVRILPLSDVEDPHWTCLAWMKSRYHIPAVQRFVQFIRERRDGEN